MKPDGASALKQIEQLLAGGEGINDKDWLGYTPLHCHKEMPSSTLSPQNRQIVLLLFPVWASRIALLSAN
jgi:ankyrin repeat protein